MAYNKAAQKYLDLGWTAPLPVPKDCKKMPPKGTTGNAPDVEIDRIEEWQRTKADSNIVLRMQGISGTEYETFGIDVDQHDDKHGGDTLAGLELQLGVLPDTWKSSARGGAGPHGIYVFRVPKGLLWESQAGDDIEIIRRGHRYMVVAPSYVTKANLGADASYHWYRTDSAKPLTNPPAASKLPLLPEAWIRYLSKGKGEKRSLREETADNTFISSAWLKNNLPGYSELPSQVMAEASDPDMLAAEAQGGAHEMLVQRSHHVIMLGVEGHHGTQKALENVQEAFYNEVLGAHGGSARRSLDDARSEVNRAIVREVQKVRQDITDGIILIAATEQTAADAEGYEDLEQVKIMRRESAKLAERVNILDYPDNDRGNAHMLMDHRPDTLIAIKGSDNFAQWDSETKSWGLVSPAAMAEQIHISVECRINLAAEDALDAGRRADDQGDDDTAKREFKLATEYKNRAKASTNFQKIKNTLAIARGIPGRSVSQDTFDSDPETLGVANGILDFSKAAGGLVEDRSDMLVEGSLKHLILLNTDTAYDADATSPIWEDYLETFLPDQKYRRFVRKALGYTLLGGNPERLIIFLQGGTSTGKTTMLEAIRAAIGVQYSGTVNVGAVFRERQDGGPNPELVSALPKRVISASEIGNHHHLHPDVIKRMTGEDQLSARMLYSNEMVGRRPAFTPVIATNSMPTIKDGDAALWRRLLVLPFDRTVAQGTKIPAKIEHDVRAQESVLRWLVDGLLDYKLEGLANEDWPDITKIRAQEFISGTSEFQSFLDHYTARVPGSEIGCEKLFSLYRNWCASEGIRENDKLTKTKFSQSLAVNGVVIRRTTKYDKDTKKSVARSYYQGIKLKGRES